MLQDAGPRGALLRALAGIDRLVLLGDVIEFRHGPARDALAAARVPLTEVAGALRPDAEIVIVPGNHDHHLAAPWLERRARKPPPPLGLEAAVDWRAGEALATIARWLAPARVRAAYPGVWLREDVYALHGHYGDRHTTVPMLERLAAGAMARVVREPAGTSRQAEDYERVLAPVYAWIHAVAQARDPEPLDERSHGLSAQAWRALSPTGRRLTLRRRALRAGLPAFIAALNRAGLGPVRADLSAPELRRAALRAAAEVLARLNVSAPHVIFGHTHRAGPLGSDERAEWRTPTGTALLNTGCWVHEPHFLGAEPHKSPYRPGFAALIGDHGPPELRCLLDADQPAPA